MNNINNQQIQDHLDYTLRQFCKAEVWQDELKYQLAPFRCQDLCVAADSHFMLAIDKTLFPTPPDYPEHDTPLVHRIYDAMGEAEDLEAYAVDDLEALCDECEQLNSKCKDDYKNVIYLAPDAFTVKVVRRLTLAARLLGASSIVMPSAQKAEQMRFFSLHDDTNKSVAYGIFMPLRADASRQLHSTSQALFAEDTANINFAAGMEYRKQKEAAEEQARKEYEASKKVWRVQVVKSAWIPVEAVTQDDAIALAQKHTSGVDDDMFDDSDIEVEAIESYPMDDDDVESMSEERNTKRQGILTDEGWISWSKYYGEDDKDDEFHQDRTRVSVSFGK